MKMVKSEITLAFTEKELRVLSWALADWIVKEASDYIKSYPKKTAKDFFNMINFDRFGEDSPYIYKMYTDLMVTDTNYHFQKITSKVEKLFEKEEQK